MQQSCEYRQTKTLKEAAWSSFLSGDESQAGQLYASSWGVLVFSPHLWHPGDRAWFQREKLGLVSGNARLVLGTKDENSGKTGKKRKVTGSKQSSGSSQVLVGQGRAAEDFPPLAWTLNRKCDKGHVDIAIYWPGFLFLCMRIYQFVPQRTDIKIFNIICKWSAHL